MRFVFWNLNRRRLEAFCAEIAFEHDIDVILLAECAFDPRSLTPLLSATTNRRWWYHPSPAGEIGYLRVFSTLGELAFRETHGDGRGRLSIRVFEHENVEHLLALLHITSKLRVKDGSQFIEAMEMADAIRQIEDQHYHRRTIAVGDLNMNPFEDAVISSRGFHAVSTRQRADAGERVVQGKSYPFFYNPMWGLFGDTTPGPAGTFYRRVSEHVGIDWNILDQVLVRPDIVRKFGSDLRILSVVGEQSLVTKRGRPDRQRGSDHLPILFSIK